MSNSIDNTVLADESETALRVVKGKSGYSPGAPWNIPEQEELKRGFDLGIDVTTLASKHHRTTTAILGQLAKMKCITQTERIMMTEALTRGYYFFSKGADLSSAADELSFDF